MIIIHVDCMYYQLYYFSSERQWESANYMIFGLKSLEFKKH